MSQLAFLFDEILRKQRIYIVRDRNGRVWKGPYRHGWTRDPKKYYLFGSETFARNAMTRTGVNGVVERVA